MKSRIRQIVREEVSRLNEAIEYGRMNHSYDSMTGLYYLGEVPFDASLINSLNKFFINSQKMVSGINRSSQYSFDINSEVVVTDRIGGAKVKVATVELAILNGALRKYNLKNW